MTEANASQVHRLVFFYMPQTFNPYERMFALPASCTSPIYGYPSPLPPGGACTVKPPGGKNTFKKSWWSLNGVKVAAAAGKRSVGGKTAAAYTVKIPALTKMKWGDDTRLCVNLLSAWPAGRRAGGGGVPKPSAGCPAAPLHGAPFPRPRSRHAAPLLCAARGRQTTPATPARRPRTFAAAPSAPSRSPPPSSSRPAGSPCPAASPAPCRCVSIVLKKKRVGKGSARFGKVFGREWWLAARCGP
jgi:hypothetical protein